VLDHFVALLRYNVHAAVHEVRADGNSTTSRCNEQKLEGLKHSNTYFLAREALTSNSPDSTEAAL